MIGDLVQAIMGDNGWDLDESLMNGTINKRKVNAIISNFKEHATLAYVLGGKIWNSRCRDNYVKHVLRQKHKYAKEKRIEAELSEDERQEKLGRRNFATRKSNVS